VKNQANCKESLQWRWTGDDNWNDNMESGEVGEDDDGVEDDQNAEAVYEEDCDQKVDDVTYDGVEDQGGNGESGSEIDSDEENDVEEISEEQKRKMMDEAVTDQAKFLYNKLVINKGRKYADKFKVHLKDIAREQLLEDLERRKQERLNRQ
jgi:hypothetical protein